MTVIDKDWVLMLIRGAHDAGYLQLGDDLIKDIQHLLCDKELKNILDMIGGKKNEKVF